MIGDAIDDKGYIEVLMQFCANAFCEVPVVMANMSQTSNSNCLLGRVLDNVMNKELVFNFIT